MALTGIAPWIVPPNYLGAMEAGSRTGLAEAGQLLQAREAENRMLMSARQLQQEDQDRKARAAQVLQNLRFQKQQARAEQNLALQKLAAQQGQAAAELQQRAAEAENLNQYRQGELGQGQQRIGIESDAAKALQDYRGGELDLRAQENQVRAASELLAEQRRQEAAAELADYREGTLDRQNRALDFQMNKAPAVKMSPIEHAELQDAVRTIGEARRKRMTPGFKEGDPAIITATAQEEAAAKAKIEELKRKYPDELGTTPAAAALTSGTTTNPAPAVTRLTYDPATGELR